MPPSALLRGVAGARDQPGRATGARIEGSCVDRVARLTDSQVATLHRRRVDGGVRAREAVAEYVSRNPWLAGSREQRRGHLHMVMIPSVAQPEMVLNLWREAEAGHSTWQRWIQELASLRPPGVQSQPDRDLDRELNKLVVPARRSDGWALTSHDFGPDRSLVDSANEANLVEVEVTESGTVRLLCGSATSPSPRMNTYMIFRHNIVYGFVQAALSLASRLSAACGYHGRWDCGVHVGGLRGANSEIDGAATYPDDFFNNETWFMTEQLASDLRSMADRILGRLLRSFDVESIVRG